VGHLTFIPIAELPSGDTSSTVSKSDELPVRRTVTACTTLEKNVVIDTRTLNLAECQLHVQWLFQPADWDPEHQTTAVRRHHA